MTKNKWGRHLCAATGAVMMLATIGMLRAQERMNDAVRLKDGTVYLGIAIADTVEKKLQIRTRSGDLKIVPLADVDLVTTYEEVRIAPRRGIQHYGSVRQEVPWTCGREYPIVFLELRAEGMKAKNLYFGGEGAAGIRLGKLSVGFGGAALYIQKKLRTPAYLHLKYASGEGCINPYIFFDIGYPFDQFVSAYKLKPSLSRITHLGPKIIGVGIGLDFKLTKFMDISADGGYRYFTLANEKIAPSCDNLVVLGYDELHSVFFRIGVTF
ncbi:MAG: hypothetical protein ACP5JH_02370 [Bacteroidota bacterium]